MLQILHVKEIGNTATFRTVFLKFLHDNLDLDYSLVNELFSFVEKPSNGGTEWIVKSQRRVAEILSACIVSMGRKIQYSENGGHSAFYVAGAHQSMGLNGILVRGVKVGKDENQFFLGIEKPAFTSDQR